MRRLFVDTVFWIALADPGDDLHAAARALQAQLRRACFVTTDEVLDEFLAYFSTGGQLMRVRAAQTVRRLLADRTLTVVEQSRQSFLAGLALYEARGDKEYSLTDCISMETMRAFGLTEVLTSDHHFTQEDATRSRT